jgi:hypothetical protein
VSIDEQLEVASPLSGHCRNLTSIESAVLMLNVPVVMQVTKVYVYTYQSANHDQHFTLLKTYTSSQVSAEGAIIRPHRNHKLKTVCVLERGRSSSFYNTKCNDI